MFKFLREKISSWAKKISSDKKVAEPEKKKREKETKKSRTKSVIESPKFKEPKKREFDKKEREVSEKVIEDIRHEENKGENEGFFKKVFSKLQKVKISEKEFEVYSEELEMLLLENNVALEVAEKIISELKEKVINREFLRKEIEGQIKEDLKDIISGILIPPFSVLEKINEKSADQAREPYVILFCGINGTGKTTTIAKIADYLSKNNVSCVLAASDTFRAASIEQLKKHGEKLGIKVIAQQYGADPAAVAFDAISYAKKNLVKCVLIDTAGRMHTAKNLMKEIEKISKVCKPDLKVFVGESITGNDIIEQVKSFDWAIGIDGIVLTKADIDEKGGTALSVSYILKKPILYLGTGQEYNKIETFSKEKFIEKLGL